MRSLRGYCGLLAVVVCLVASPPARATVLTFEDLTDGPVPNGYGGLIWDGYWTNWISFFRSASQSVHPRLRNEGGV